MVLSSRMATAPPTNIPVLSRTMMIWSNVALPVGHELQVWGGGKLGNSTIIVCRTSVRTSYDVVREFSLRMNTNT